MLDTISPEIVTGGIRTIPPGFTRGLDFGPQTDSAQDGALLEEEVEEVEIQPIYRPMFDVQRDGRIKSQVSLPHLSSIFLFSLIVCQC